MTNDVPPTGLREIRTKVRGVSRDGRQAVAVRLRPGQKLRLEREPTNPKDPNAIRLMADRRQVGYVSADLASRLAPWMDRRHTWSATVLEVTGGEPDAPTYGVNFVLRYTGPSRVASGEKRSWWRRLLDG